MLTNNWFSRYTQNDYTSHDKGYYHRILEYSSRVQVSTLYWKIQCKLPPKTKRFCPLVLK